MENIFDLSKNGAKKVYIDGELFPIRVGMREISLQNGEKVLVYDTSGPYTEENHTIDIQRGIRKVRENWTRERFDKQNFHTQLWYARQGIVTPEMEYVAIRENQGVTGENRITPEIVREEIAAGRAILPSNYRHPEAEPMIIGSKFLVKINANIGMIDRNSTITVRGRNLKMLRIQVPDWETEKEHFRLKLHDYFEHVVKMGIETIEKNGNLTEFLGRMITTRKLYDDIVGIQNVKIKLYKIEAEREVPISWSEVSANSGGEGFLSAFVILTCLLSYMRRDETDLFSSGEEGKVLIMDNPFAQTNAEHLLKPLIEMAKKTNTQLICLSGLGGDSIYNRFDNIYVLKLVESSIRNGVQRVDVTHMKGEETKRMVLSEFKMEQMSLFEMMEE